MESFVQDVLEWWEDQSTEDQAYLTQVLASVPAHFIGYKLYRKMGAPKWAAYGLAGLGLTAAMAPARFAYEQRQRVRRASRERG